MASYTANPGDTVQLQHATILIQDNEIWLVQDPTWADPIGFSMVGSGPDQRSIGKLSFKTNKGGTLTPDQAVELVLIQGKRRLDDPNDETGELYVGINNGAGNADANMVDVLLIHHDSIEALVPINGAPAAPMPVSQFPNKLVSPDGRVEMDIQNADALNMTLYLDGVALWSVLTGTTPEGKAKGFKA